jgi:predicted dehydrogenase/threonine dehydrogenase-like Zn-dependent dehydrogenase
MNQLTQQLKSGKMEITEVPFPALKPGSIMVMNQYSVISAGTEGKTVTDARKGYIAKAKSRQKEVKQVLDMIKTNGILSTYKLVMNKLEAPSPLGYCSAGRIIGVASDVTSFKVGDLVACGGTNHAEVVIAPVNLCVKLKSIDLIDQTVFATIGAIAIQGIRQAKISMGENCLIIGMGLIGQLTYKILEASGIFPIGVDVSDSQIKQAQEAGIKHVYNRNSADLEELIGVFTRGNGCDAVIIAAGSSSLDPVEFAGTIARTKARVVIVGAVPTGFSRSNYYRKELELIMSCSYGPGRYDLNYEQKGIDYPIGYVRWTENRNMISFIDLIENNRIDIRPLITHRFKLEQAPEAYDMILNRSEQFTGILIEYDIEKKTTTDSITVNTQPITGNVSVSFIGAGSFAQNMLLPNLKGICEFNGIITATGVSAKYVAEKYGFRYVSSDLESIIHDETTNLVFIASRHDNHASQVLRCLIAKKNVFVEKPLAMNFKELESIRKAYFKVNKSEPVQLMVGFNRRFSPAVINVKKRFSSSTPKSIFIRVNAGVMPVNHWVNDPDIGGGRVIGEACHFIDLAMFLSGGRISKVHAFGMADPNSLNNTVTINLEMDNGSIGTVVYYSNGNKKVSKELVEVFCGGAVARIDDFKSVQFFGNKSETIKFRGQDKGHKNELVEFIKSIKEGLPSPISFDDSYISMKATLLANESLKSGNTFTV